VFGTWVNYCEALVRHLYAIGGSDQDIGTAVAMTLRELVPEMDERIIPYLAANVLAKIKFADPEKPLGDV
jgi:hypothetical protein